MTTDDAVAERKRAEFNANLAKIEQLSQRLVEVTARKPKRDPGLEAPGQDLLMKAGSAWWAETLNNPARMIEQQAAFWGKTMTHFVEAQQALANAGYQAPQDETPTDKRFSNPLWQSHPYFNFLKQQFMMNAEAIKTTVADMNDLAPGDRKRMEFFSSQIIDLMSPSNFLGSNPDALERAVETDGQSLVDGLENLVRDLEDNSGEFLVRLADSDAFEVGVNLALSPGSVVYRNRMFELIQYTPATESVHQTPLVLFPPWINKFYIMDLKEKNSLIKWIVDQGFTLFVVSWVNPDASYADVGLEEYIEEGYLTAIEQVKQITGEEKVNAIGYCIAGTTLSLTLALMARRGDNSVNAATFFTTLTDFSDQGEVGVFLDDDFVDGIAREVAEKGIMESYLMSRTFSYLRSNDLIYAPAIRSYLMGLAPPAFDLLYWNGDGTNLPARMTMQYLRGLCQNDRFSSSGFELFGESLHISDVNVPLCAIACESDHIAAWKSSYNGISQMGSADKSFILSESGHIAGIINPPSKKKYGHYSNPDMGLAADDWKEGAAFTSGSWWPRWGEWLVKRSGKQVPARITGDASHPVLAPAPGTYVKSSPAG
jgi:poly[(R)-3-hydroxyalkanoate] polymerase subunit PhaC